MNVIEVLARRWVLGALVLGTLQPWATSGAADADQSARQNAGLQVICVPDTPIAHPGESITVRAWVMDMDGKPAPTPVVWSWSASTGTIIGGDTATWSLEREDAKAVGTKRSTAKVTAQDESLGQATCELTVIVAQPIAADFDMSKHGRMEEKGETIRGERLRGRSFLLPGVDEPKGYGLYSYLLFNAPPKDAAERARHLGAIESYLLWIQPIAEMERYHRRSQMNLALLPVKRDISLPDNLSDPNLAVKSAENVLAVYDYARAQSILADLGSKAVRSGPYLVSTMPAGSGAKHTMLFFDMSRVVPPLVFDWVRTFYALAAKERSWSEIALSKLALNTRNVLAVAAKDTPEVVSELAKLIVVFKPR